MITDIAKTASMLKNATDQQLADMMQSTTPSAPSYVVLAELQRRKQLRQEAETPSAPPQQSVRDQIESNMGSMDQNTMASQNEAPPVQQAFAHGGTVAQRGYDDGGRVAPKKPYSLMRPWYEGNVVAKDAPWYMQDPAKYNINPLGHILNPNDTIPSTNYNPNIPADTAQVDPSQRGATGSWDTAPKDQPPKAGLDTLQQTAARKSQTKSSEMMQTRGGAPSSGTDAANSALKYTPYTDGIDYSKLKDNSNMSDYDKQYLDAYGPDEYGAMIDKMSADKTTKADSNLSTDKWLALAKAGYGLASGTNWADGIAKGLSSGTDAISQAVATRRAADTDIEKLMIEKAKVNSAERQAKGAYKVGELSSRDKDNRNVDLAQVNASTQIGMKNNEGVNAVAKAQYDRAFDQSKLSQEMAMNYAKIAQADRESNARVSAGAASSKDLVFSSQLSAASTQYKESATILQSYSKVGQPPPPPEAIADYNDAKARLNNVYSLASKSGGTTFEISKNGSGAAGLNMSAFDKKVK